MQKDLQHLSHKVLSRVNGFLVFVRDQQTVVLFGELHVAKHCKDEKQKEVVNIPSLVEKWHHTHQAKIILELPPPGTLRWDVTKPLDREKHGDATLKDLAQSMWKGKDTENVYFSDVRYMFHPTQEVLEDIFDLPLENESLTQTAIHLVQELCLNALILPTAQSEWIRTQKKKFVDEIPREDDKSVFEQAFRDVMDMHVFDMLEMEHDTNTMDQFESNVKFLGQKLSDLFGVIPPMLSSKDNCVFFGGTQHLVYLQDLLPKFGFRLVDGRYNNLDETNCLPP
jgi:hypothetical protein